ncbi:MAG TPA: sulfatase [Vicinamibacteria bacterium]|nr:sulfatase [Vicinamibacteria bacterium]
MRGIARLLLLALVVPGCRPSRSPRPSVSAVAIAPERLNVLLITIDTLRADHLSAYGYARATSPRMDALGKQGTLFERAYTFWPKTRGSFVALLTGKAPSGTGYSKTHPVLLDFNATLASTLKAAGYVTSAIVDNPNVAASLGYSKGFDVYRETWQEPSLGSETLRARAITEGGMAFLQAARPEKPFLLWLHYVNPHAPYEPPPPFDTMFAPRGGDRGPRLAVVPGYHGGVAKQWARPGLDHLGDYVGLYDGEIASVDQEVGRVADALRASAVGDRTLVVITSDHGESLGEHDYYFDHGENVFEPSLRIPLIVVKPSAPAGQRSLAFASTLDLVPTVLDAVKVSWPPDLAGVSLLGAVEGKGAPKRDRLFAQNDRNLSASFGEKLKVVATPDGDRVRFALFDREKDPGETRDVSKERADDLRGERRELELFTERADREWARTRPLVEGRPAGRRLSAEDCERLKALGYVDSDCE